MQFDSSSLQSRRIRVAELFRVEVHDGDHFPVLYLALTDIVQVGSPLRIVLKVFGDVLRKKDVPGVSAIHHPLRNVNTGSRYVGAVIYIGDLVYGAAVDTHSNPKFGIVPERLTEGESGRLTKGRNTSIGSVRMSAFVPT